MCRASKRGKGEKGKRRLGMKTDCDQADSRIKVGLEWDQNHECNILNSSYSTASGNTVTKHIFSCNPAAVVTVPPEQKQQS